MTPTLSPTAQALLDAAIEAKSSAGLLVYSEFLEDSGEPKKAIGWRCIGEARRWPLNNGRGEYVWYDQDTFSGTQYAKDESNLPSVVMLELWPMETLPECYMEYPSLLAALTAAAEAFATVRGME